VEERFFKCTGNVKILVWEGGVKEGTEKLPGGLEKHCGLGGGSICKGENLGTGLRGDKTSGRSSEQSTGVTEVVGTAQSEKKGFGLGHGWSEKKRGEEWRLDRWAYMRSNQGHFGRSLLGSSEGGGVLKWKVSL